MQLRVEFIIRERLRGDAPVAWVMAGEGWRTQRLRSFYSGKTAFHDGLAALAADLGKAGMLIEPEAMADLDRVPVLELTVEEFILRVASVVAHPEEDARSHHGNVTSKFRTETITGVPER